MKLRGASLVSLARIGVTSVVQLAFPAVTLAAWGDAGFALVVSLQGLASYATMGDAGLQGYLTQRAAVLLGKGENAAAAGVLKMGLQLLLGLAAVAAVVANLAFLLLGEKMWRDVGSAAGATPTQTIGTFVVVVFSVAVALSCSGWATAIEAGSGKLARCQWFGISRYAVNTGGVVLLAMLGFSPIVTLMLASVAAIVHDLVRFMLAWRLFFRPLPKGSPVNRAQLLLRSSAGLLIVAANATQNGLQAAVSTGLDIGATAIAVPGRTVSNAARQFSTAVGNVAWVAVARSFAATDDNHKKFAQWGNVTRLLTGLQFVGTGIIAILAPFALPLWLPSKAPMLVELMPVYIAEQAIVSLFLTGNYLLIADGRFGTSGSIQMVGAAITVVLTWWLIPTMGPLGFALATLVGGSAFLACFTLILERRWWRDRGISTNRAVARRLGLIGIVAALGFLSSRLSPLAIGLLIVAIGGMEAVRGAIGVAATTTELADS